MPRMARFMCASRQVVGFDSWPKIEMSVRLPAVGLDEAFRLHEHAAGAAAGVVDAALVGLEHLDQQPHDAARREELAAELALGLGELAEEVLVDAAERVAGLGAVALEADVGDQVDQPLQLLRRDAAAGVVARQLALEVRVVALDGEDGVVDQRGDVGARWPGSAGSASVPRAAPRRRARRCTRRGSPAGFRAAAPVMPSASSSAVARRAGPRRRRRCTSGRAGRGRRACTRLRRPDRAARRPTSRGCRRRRGRCCSNPDWPSRLLFVSCSWPETAVFGMPLAFLAGSVYGTREDGSEPGTTI